MTALAIGSSVTSIVRDGGTVAIATNGGLGTITRTAVGGTTVTINFGPEPTRRVFGPYSEGASLTITNLSCNAFDYDPQTTDAASDFLGAFAWLGLPDPASYAGYRARVTDGGPTGGVYVVSDGTRWKPVNGSANLATLGAAVSGITNTEQIVLQSLLPVNFWKLNDTLRLWLTTGKSGSTDAGNITVRVGTAGTVADTAITGLSAFALMAASGVAGAGIFDIKLLSATSAQKLGGNGANTHAYQNASNTQAAAATPISDATANALYVSVSLASGGTTNTVSINSGQIQLITP